MLFLVAACVLIMLASLAGKLTLWRSSGGIIERNLGFLVSFSAGVFLLLAYQLSAEAIEHTQSFTIGLLWIFGGAIVIWLITILIPALHQHDFESEGHARLDPRRMLVSDAVHNVGDGVFLAASFVVSPIFGLWASISIFIHELLQEISEFFVLRNAGYSVKKALLLNFAVSATILFGALGGYVLIDVFETFEGPLLGIAAGGILVFVLHDLIPHSLREVLAPAHYLKHVFFFVLGGVLMFGVMVFIPHAEAAYEGEIQSSL